MNVSINQIFYNYFDKSLKSHILTHNKIYLLGHCLDEEGEVSFGWCVCVELVLGPFHNVYVTLMLVYCFHTGELDVINSQRLLYTHWRK